MRQAAGKKTAAWLQPPNLIKEYNGNEK